MSELGTNVTSVEVEVVGNGGVAVVVKEENYKGRCLGQCFTVNVK
jgi:hypothetical protein